MLAQYWQPAACLVAWKNYANTPTQSVDNLCLCKQSFLGWNLSTVFLPRQTAPRHRTCLPLPSMDNMLRNWGMTSSISWWSLFPKFWRLRDPSRIQAQAAAMLCFRSMLGYHLRCSGLLSSPRHSRLVCFFSRPRLFALTSYRNWPSAIQICQGCDRATQARHLSWGWGDCRPGIWAG
jgi:hypothetical protein